MLELRSMFTGIVTAVGRVIRAVPRGQATRLEIEPGRIPLANLAIGDSLAVNGVCLTLIDVEPACLAMDLGRETLEATTFGRVQAGDPVNLEMALRLSDRLGGHLLSGHVDGIGTVLSRADYGEALGLRLAAPAGLARYLCRKGSVAVDGVSLTINAVQGAEFEVLLVPHTLAATIAKDYRAGSPVNIEVDLIARYVESLLLAPRDVR